MKMLSPRDTWRLLFPARVIFFGLLAAQIIGTLLVRQSNLALDDKLTALRAAGYGPLPGMGVIPSLTGWPAALAGGLYFTLSIGAGVALLSFGAWLVMTVLPPRKKKIAGILLAGLWLALLIWGNADGFCCGMTAFLVLVPVPVLWFARRWAPAEKWHPGRGVIHLCLIAALLLFWASRLNHEIFVNIKDNLLLTSAPGKKMVDLYYRYTLYPAEVVKAPYQKQVKTCHLKGFCNEAWTDAISAALADENYFAVGRGTADLVLTRNGGRLQFICGEKTALTAPPSEFLAYPERILKRFSKKCDRNAAFRYFTLFSLAGLSPLLLYLLFFSVFAVIPGMLIPLRVSFWLVPMFCCLLGGGIIFYLDAPPAGELDRQAAAEALAGEGRKKQLAALRYIFYNRLNLVDFPEYRKLLDTPDFATNYWLIKNLAYSRAPDAGRWLVRYLKADSSYLACKAMEALGRTVDAAAAKTGNRSDFYKKLLVKKLTSSDNWYVQLYAYQTARRLGWKPVKSS